MQQWIWYAEEPRLGHPWIRTQT